MLTVAGTAVDFHHFPFSMALRAITKQMVCDFYHILHMKMQSIKHKLANRWADRPAALALLHPSHVKDGIDVERTVYMRVA